MTWDENDELWAGAIARSEELRYGEKKEEEE